MNPSEFRGELHLTYEEFALAAGIRPAVLARLIRLGVVEPARPETVEFSVATLARLRRMLRLHEQLGVNFTGAAIILDLLDRLRRLEGLAPGSALEGAPAPARLPPPDEGR